MGRNLSGDRKRWEDIEIMEEGTCSVDVIGRHDGV